MYDYIMVGYYDVVLGLIPISLAGLTALLLTGGLSLSLAVPLASTAAIGLMGHAMFVNGPGTGVVADAATPTSETNAGGHQPAD